MIFVCDHVNRSYEPTLYVTVLRTIPFFRVNEDKTRAIGSIKKEIGRREREREKRREVIITMQFSYVLDLR